MGNYTRLMLEKAAQSTLGPSAVRAIESNIVSREENVAAVVAKVALGEADAGFAYASDAAGSSAPNLTVIPLPPELSSGPSTWSPHQPRLQPRPRRELR